MLISDWSSDVCSSVLRRNLEVRHKLASETRRYLDRAELIEVETPVLIKSTPEVARDVVVPSRINPGEFSDRKNVVKGEGVTVQVDLGGRSISQTTYNRDAQ